MAKIFFLSLLFICKLKFMVLYDMNFEKITLTTMIYYIFIRTYIYKFHMSNELC